MTSHNFFSIAESVENYTPRGIWKRAEKVMGGIDIDPAADEAHAIPAATHYTKAHDGLTQPWTGRVWLNPPFGKDINRWFTKLAKEFIEGRTTEAVVLWKTALETEATRILVAIPEYRCSAVPRKRISYHSGVKKQGGGDSATFTTILHYFGPNQERFTQIFSEIADIWVCTRHSASTQEKIL